MKAYIIKLTFVDIQPEVWRRVIIPAGATFNRLHETIQYVTNFQSEMEPYHYFGIEIEDLYITNNEALQEKYKGKKFGGRTIKQPSRIKIDAYLEKHREYIYNYDFGDDWYIRVTLEEIEEDYYFGYPTLLAGVGIAPPEDVGGPSGYDEFIEVYNNPTHSDYLSTYAWAERQFYLPLDIDEVNERLKSVKYKKTEWQQIDHDNYVVLSDKYRGSDLVDVEALPNKDLIIQYAIACANLYGLIEYPEFVKIYNAQNEPSLSSNELRAILKSPLYSKQLENADILVHKHALIHEAIGFVENYAAFLQSVVGKPFYVPVKEELLRYTDDFYYEKTSYQEKLADMMAKDFFGGSKLMVKEEIDELVGQLQIVEGNFNGVVSEFLGRFILEDMKQVNQYVQAITMIANTTRIWENRGHTPHELSQMAKYDLKTLPNEQLKVINGGKVGRNEPCLCGSGKKYKKCCGK